MTTTASNLSPTEAYRAARDSLLELRGRHDDAVATFTWPDVGERFNWAIDWFDAVARGNHRTAIVIVEEDSSSLEVTYDEMARRSDAVATWLAEQGVKRGDPVVLMLGNQIELWDLMLAVMKLGAIIMPTTTAVGPADLRDRIARGGVRHVVANAGDVDKFSGVPGEYTRLSVGAADGWSDLHGAYRRVGDVPPTVDAVIARAMAKSAADRFGTCREFAAALSAAVHTRPAVRRPVHSAGPPGRIAPPRHRPAGPPGAPPRPPGPVPAPPATRRQRRCGSWPCRSRMAVSAMRSNG